MWLFVVCVCVCGDAVLLLWFAAFNIYIMLVCFVCCCSVVGAPHVLWRCCFFVLPG